MSVGRALYLIAAARPQLIAIIGDRFYPVTMPPDVFAGVETQDGDTETQIGAVTYTLISDPREASHDGPSGLGRARYQFDCWAPARRNGVPDMDTAAEIAKQLRLAFHNAHGYDDGDTLGGFLPGGTDRDMPDPLTNRARRVIDITFWHEEATA